MTEQDADEPVNFVLLDEAAKKLLGYYVYRKFRAYLASITAALHQQYQDGLHVGLTRPTVRGLAMLFDFRALDYDALIEIIGVYMYVLSCHKSANWRLLQRYEAKQVLYLRGYDFEAAFSIGAGQTGPIDCLPLYVSQLQLRIYSTLLLGEHAATGRALAAYSAVMRSVSDHYSPTGARGGELSEENRTRLLPILDNHKGFAEYAGRRLLAYGRSHEFMDQSEQANATWDAIFDATRRSADKVFTGRQRPPV